jgi:hypothetical protein
VTLRRVMPKGLTRLLARLLPPGNRPGHGDSSVYRGGSAGIDGEAAARGATGSAHQETTHPSRYGGGDR